MSTIIEIKPMAVSDYSQMVGVMKAAYTNWQGSLWGLQSIERLIRKFPEGQFVAMANDVVVGCALSIIVRYDEFEDDHTYRQITGNYTFSTHTDKGDVLYGIEVFVHPEYRGLRLGRRLYDARKELCEKLNLRAIVFGGRIPTYHKYADTLRPREYIQKVKHKEIYDPVLSFQLSNDFHVKRIIRNYMPEDDQSQEYAVLLQWDNVYHQAESATENRIRKNVRIGLVQWKMRLFQSKEEMFQHAEYFIDSISSYKADFALLPEYFNAPLMASMQHLNEAEAIRELAKYTDEIRETMSTWSVEYNVNIITGSMPLYINDELKNIGFVCHRNGEVESYEKIHVTPDEVKYWGLKGGDILQTYDTDAGRIGVLICYDVEFPELSRLLADEGMQILFVPYLTDTQNGYTRVRLCAQARAVENECFVAITGSVGNLPQVDNMDIHYSQAAVFTPSDFSFPSNGIKSESTPNTEMVLIADVDLKLLDQLHQYGSVRNMKDRRKDFYQLKKVIN